MRTAHLRLALLAGLCGALTAQAQLDDDKRELIQLGYNQPIQGYAPLSAYGFYYLNVPHFVRTNYYLRLAVAPVYFDSELGFKNAFGEHTDVGLGVSGGGFADSYYEFHRGEFIRSESFTGHGGGPVASVYHLFNPRQRIPLYGILRGGFHYSVYARDSDTASNFQLPEDRGTIYLRSGFRWGGREPLILPEVAMELSAWYEAQVRLEWGPYGFNGDREVEPLSHLFWSRALLVYTLPELQHNFSASVTLGTSIHPDRFSAYRIGGTLPLASEFPLSVPGYYFQEISARKFVLFSGSYLMPLDREKRWAVMAAASAAAVDFLPGLSQPSEWVRGVGGGITYRSPTKAWQMLLSYGYGIDAIRSTGRGAHTVGVLIQFDLDRAGAGLFEPGENPIRSRGLERFFHALNLF